VPYIGKNLLLIACFTLIGSKCLPEHYVLRISKLYFGSILKTHMYQYNSLSIFVHELIEKNLNFSSPDLTQNCLLPVTFPKKYEGLLKSPYPDQEENKLQ
jgi:hypothetical protein